MIETKLFYRKDNAFYKTEKGKEYKKFLLQEFTEDEFWLINYLFILDSFFEKWENFLITKSKEVYDIYTKFFSKNFIEEEVLRFIKEIKEIKTFHTLVEKDYFYLHSFYDEEEFLKLYATASFEEKKELYHYVEENHRIKSYNCCLSRKYKSGGSYTIATIKEDAKIFYLSIAISELEYNGFTNTLHMILDIYAKIYKIDKEKVFTYLKEEQEILEPIFKNIFMPDEDEQQEEIRERKDEKIVIIEQDIPQERIDDTTKEGQKYLNQIFQKSKNKVRERAENECELHRIQNCRYFTSRKTKKNYLEIHHLIPKQFRNNFEYSIDILSNYVALCPHCHKMLHLAVDEERKYLIEKLFLERKKRLKQAGLKITINDIYKYYRIEVEKEQKKKTTKKQKTKS